MKKLFIIGATTTLLVPFAHAQSSVTLYGVADAGITYTSNVRGNSRWSLGSGVLQQSRWGLRGAEDLGNGLKAIFTLEDGFDISNGQQANNGGLFNRQAYVGLASDYGTVTLGRQYDAMQDYVAPLSATGSWGGTYFAHPFNNDNLNANGGFNNSIKFASANYSGFTFGGTYGFSNQTNFANNRQYSLGAAYQFQGLRVAAAYAQQNNPGASTVGATDAGNAPLLSALNAALGNFRAREFGAGVGYLFGPASFGLVWTQSRQDNFAASTVGSLRFNNYEFNASYNVTAALRVGVAYTFSDGRLYDSQAGNDAIRYHQVGLQTNYALSKRTDAYAQVVYQRTAGDSGVGPSIYNGTNTGFSSSRNQSAVSVGIRHKF